MKTGASSLGINNLPCCWVCDERFSDAVPPGPLNREEHHIIPRQAGGEDGPQVSLCDGHHSKLHKIASRMSANKPYFDLIHGEPQAYHQKLLWLAVKVRDAFAATADDPNKKRMVVMTLDQTRVKQLDRLRKVYPSARSREAMYNLALEMLYRKHFTE
jgi:hypothetical protein